MSVKSLILYYLLHSSQAVWNQSISIPLSRVLWQFFSTWERCLEFLGCHLIPLNTQALPPTSNLIVSKILSKKSEEKDEAYGWAWKRWLFNIIPIIDAVSLPLSASILSFCHTLIAQQGGHLTIGNWAVLCLSFRCYHTYETNL